MSVDVGELKTDDTRLRQLRAQAMRLGIKHAGMSVEELEAAIAEAQQEKEQAEDQAQEPKPETPASLDAQLEAQVTQLGRATAEKLRRCPRERVVVAKDPLNKDDKYVWVGINGWNFRIEREVPVELPTPVIDLLEQGGYVVRRAR